ncbi:MAG TPA: PEP-CTERM sorting domain-containing protein [Candidatus Brocadiia bacterium]|nr:PEP-CTERM sorting domain-containing protein [Candidatus Brocadiia bacterium]
MKKRILGWILALVALCATWTEARTYLFGVNSTYTNSLRLWANAPAYGNLGTRGTRITGWFVLNVDPFYTGTKRVEWVSLDIRNIDRVTFEMVYSGYVAQAYLNPSAGTTDGMLLDLNNCSLDGAIPMSTASTWRMIDNLGVQNQQMRITYNLWYILSGIEEWQTIYGTEYSGNNGEQVIWDGAFTGWSSTQGGTLTASMALTQGYRLSLEDGLIVLYAWASMSGTATVTAEPTQFAVLDVGRTYYAGLANGYDLSRITMSTAGMTWYPTIYLSNTVRRYAAYEGGATQDVANYGNILWQGLNSQSVGARLYRSGDTPPGYTNVTTTWGSASYAFGIPASYIGTYQVQMNFAGGGNYLASNPTEQIAIYHQTGVSYTGPGSGLQSSTINVSAQLNDLPLATGLGSQVITWVLSSGTTPVSTVTAVSNGSGYAYQAMTLPLTPGGYTITTTFTDSGFYVGSSDSDPFTVNVPEPASAVLMLGGLGLAGMLRRRIREKKQEKK